MIFKIAKQGLLSTGVLAYIWTATACAGRFDEAAFAPGPMAHNAMDRTHEDSFPMPELDDDDKEGKVVMGVLGAAAAVGTAVLLVWMVKEKM